eukprot:COSAG05_NODE_478_length_9434_cov_5.178897_6_plen_248_part_00
MTTATARAATLLGVMASATAQPCPPPPVAPGWTAVPYRGGVGPHGHSYDAHDCECWSRDPSDGSKKYRAQCKVVGNIVHLGGTIQCAPGDSHCFGGASGVDSDVFATLPAACRPTQAVFSTSVELISEQPLVNPAASVGLSIEKSGTMRATGSSINCQGKEHCPYEKWCMLLNVSFPINPPPPPPLSAAPCIRFGHATPVANHVDVTIVNEADATQTYTWSDYQFGQFSDWVNVRRCRHVCSPSLPS